MSDRAYALRFISGKYQGGEYPLAAAGELVIGRSTDLDMVLIEDMVSRKHARITLAPDQITIADLGSTNGTFVNGEKVRRALLKEGDRILIGTSILKLVAVSRPTGGAVDSKAAQQNLERTAAAQEKRQGGRTSVQGRLEEVPLVDLLQLLSTSKKTGAIVIKGYRSGRVHLRTGKVVSAVIDADPTLPPKKALYRMISWTQGGFEFVPQEGDLAPIGGRARVCGRADAQRDRRRHRAPDRRGPATGRRARPRDASGVDAFGRHRHAALTEIARAVRRGAGPAAAGPQLRRRASRPGPGGGQRPGDRAEAPVVARPRVPAAVLTRAR